VSWQPLGREELEQLMSAGLSEADDPVRAAWQRIRIEPERWQCSPWGDLAGGFWAVAVTGGVVIWFNDIEEGFNASPFRERGVIGEYACNQRTFAEMLGELPEAVEAEAFAARQPSLEVPPGLAGPGLVERRQTTSWTLRSAAGRRFRVHFSGKRETRFLSANYSSVELLDAHPVLQNYQERWTSLFVSNAKAAPPTSADRLDACVAAVTQGWRSLRDYQRAPADAVLWGDHGLLMRGPRSVVRVIAETLSELGVTPSIVGEWNERGGSGSPRVLLLGRNFVVADAVRFEGVADVTAG
jgi:hypothetical protein